jgi:putative cardiolipin synthase
MILNTEIGVVVSSEQFARSVARFANDLARIECSYRLGLEGESANLVWDAGNSKTRSRYLREPGASVWRRLLVFLISSLPIEKQL